MWQEQQSRWLPIHNRLNDMQRLVSLTEDAWIRLDSLPPESRLSQSALVQQIALQRFPFSVSKFGRVFNGITSLERSLRAYMRFDNQPVGCVDIGCCQPALLGFLIHNHAPPHEGGFRLDSYKPAGRSGPFLSLSLPHCLPSVPESELERFCALAEGADGGLYAYLLDALGWDGSDRDRLKRKFLRDVLAKKGRYPSEVEEAFKLRFPNVWAFVWAVNRFDHATLIRTLQLLESWLVILVIAPTVEAPFVTLHDGAYCRLQDTPALTEAFQRGFKTVGLRASLKVC